MYVIWWDTSFIDPYGPSVPYECSKRFSPLTNVATCPEDRDERIVCIRMKELEGSSYCVDEVTLTQIVTESYAYLSYRTKALAISINMSNKQLCIINISINIWHLMISRQAGHMSHHHKPTRTCNLRSTNLASSRSLTSPDAVSNPVEGSKNVSELTKLKSMSIYTE